MFVKLAADFLEMRFARPVCGTILGGAYTPPPILNLGNPKKEVVLLVETVAVLDSLEMFDEICKSGCSATSWFAVYLPCALNFSHISFRWRKNAGVN